MVQDEKELTMPKEWWEDEYEINDTIENPDINRSEPNDPDIQIIKYENHVPLSMINRQYSDEEKRWLRPICETLAMLQGNAFFGINRPDGCDWYEQWLPEAAAIFYGNGGPTGWAGETSWMTDMVHESSNVEDA